MQSHRDDDANAAKTLKALEQRAKGMVERGESQITAGKPGESSLAELDTQEGIRVRRMPDDELCLRVSVGESEYVPGSGYLVFRGDPYRIAGLIGRAQKAMQEFLRE